MMSDTVLRFATNAGIALAILLGGIWLARIIRFWLGRLLKLRGVDPMLGSFLRSVAHILVIVFVIIAALSQLGIQTSSLVAVVGAAGLAVGLALQSSLSNFAAGVMIIVFRPFKVGDYIEAAGVGGNVEEIQIFSTQLSTGDNKTVIVPNSSITGGTITNYSAKGTRRVDLVFGISYRDDIGKARRILREILDREPRVLKEPEPVIAVSELAESKVNFIVRPWVKTEDYWEVYWAVTETVKLKFDEAGITIPLPQREMHVYQSKV